ncbi:putative reverse transcriptase domain-containing protein [Tanacetum coccineum]
MPPRMTTQSAGQATAAPRGGRMGGRIGRGGGRTRVTDFSTIIAQQLQNLLPTILAHVGNQGRNQGNGRNKKGDAINDNIRGDVRNVIENNDRMGCTYKEFLACNPKEYDGKGGAIEDFKILTRDEFFPINEMKKLETEFWNHAMVGAGHTAYTDRFHELARLVPHLVTPKNKRIERNGSLKKNPEKRGNNKDSSRDRNARDENKRTRTRNALLQPLTRACFNYGRLGHMSKDCRVAPRIVNPVEPSTKARGKLSKQVVANNGGQARGKNGSQARGRAFMLGAEEARQDPNIVTEPSDLGFSYEIEIASGQLKQEEIVMVRDFLEVFSDDLLGLPPIQEIKFLIELVPGAIPIARSPYRLEPSEMEELSGQLKELQDKDKFVIGFIDDILVYSKSREEHEVHLGHVINGDGIHVDPKNFSMIAKSLTILTHKCKTSDWGEEQERAFQTSKEKLCNAPVLALPDRPEDFMVYCDVYRSLYVIVLTISEKISRVQRKASRNALFFKMKNLVNFVEIVQETTKMISQIKDRLKAARDHQKSYADKRRKHLEFSVGNHVLLKVSPWKGVVHFEKKGKLSPRFVGPFKIIESVDPVAYRLRPPEELNGVHDTFHVSNLKKCLADPTLQVPLDEIQVDAKLNFVEEPMEILEREFKKLKRSRITIVKVRWNSKSETEFTWEREDQMKINSVRTSTVLTVENQKEDISILAWNPRPTRNFSMPPLTARISLNVEDELWLGVMVALLALIGHEVERVAEASHCKKDSLPFSYLWLEVGNDMFKVANWVDVIERFYRRLLSWKSKSLSIGDVSFGVIRMKKEAWRGSDRTKSYLHSKKEAWLLAVSGQKILLSLASGGGGSILSQMYYGASLLSVFMEKMGFTFCHKDRVYFQPQGHEINRCLE